MADVQVKVNVDYSQFNELEKAVAKLENKKIEIKIENKGFSAFNEETLKSIQYQTRLASMQARLETAITNRIRTENQLKIAQERTNQAQEKTRQAIQKTSQEYQKTAQQAEKTAQSENKLRESQERTTQAYQKTEQEAQKTNQQIEKTAQASEKTAQKMLGLRQSAQQVGQSFEEAGEEVDIFGTKAVQAIDKFWTRLESRMVHMFLNKVRQATNEALNMMHAVDDELVTVRKVSGWDADTMQQVQEGAYKVAKQYGIDPQDYLNSVSEMVRAGYREDAEALAELSIKTQIVGDVTSDVANQFLIATDKAYGYNGSIKELNKVLDGANEIDNKYATSISKIASGMGIVAPVASQMHVGVDELAASIGTITAVTQRSGTEAARALRAIFLNIVGDTKTEIDEGVTWTTGEIAGLRDVLRKYVPDLVREADIEGKIIDPMRAIEGLSNAMKEGLLSEQELMSMVSDIGGKLRSSQLLALIQNWDMYTEMLNDFGNAAGSADREVANAMDSWTRKAKQLKAAWTELVQHYFNSDTMKGILDGLTKLVEWLDKNTWAVNTLIGVLAVLAATTFSSHLITQFHSVYTAVVELIPVITNVFETLQIAGMVAADNVTAAMSAMAGTVAGIFAEILGGIGIVFGEFAIAYGLDQAVDRATDRKSRKEIGEAKTAAEKLDYMEAVNDSVQLAETNDDLAQSFRELLDAMELTEVEGQQAIKTYGGMKEAANALMISQRHLAAEQQKEADEQIQRQANRAVVSGFKGAYSGLNDAYVDTSVTSETLQTWIKATQESYEYINSLDELVSYYESLLRLEKQFQEEAEFRPEILDSDMYKAVEAEIKEYGTDVEIYREYLETQKEQTEEAVEANEELAESLGEPITSLNSLSTSLANATAQLQAYSDALGMDERGNFADKGSTLGQYKEIYDAAMEHFNAGEYGSTQYQAAMRLLLPESVLQEIEYDYEKAGEIASSKYFEALMGSAEDGGAEFANQLYDLWESNSDGLEGVLDIVENSDGSFDVLIDDFDKLGEMLGIDGGALAAWSDQMDIFNKGLNWTQKDLDEFVEKAGALKTLSDGVTQQIDLDKFFGAIIEGAKSAGKSQQELESDIYHVAEYLEGLEDYTFTGTISQIEEAKDKALGLAQGVGDASDEMSEMGDEEATPTLDLDNSLFLTKIQISKKALEDLGKTTVTPKVALSGAVPTHLAEGTDSAPAGIALTGEEGPELVLEGDNARVVGQDGPEITTLQEGAKVYTAEETADIFNRKGSGKIPAFWGGGSFTRSGTRVKNTPVAKQSGASRSSKVSSAGKSDTTDAQKEQIELHKKKVDLLETELDLLEAQDKPVRDQVAKIKEIQNALLDQIHYMESIGAEQADINKLYVEWYKWNDQIAKLQKEIYDDLDDAIDNELDEIKDYYDEQKDAIDEQIDALKEARDTKDDELDLEKKLLAVEEARANLANAQAERTVRMYNAQTGQWEWVANAKNVQNAQEALDKAEEDLAKFYEDAAYDAQVSALEAMKDALDDEYESIKEQWQKILDALEEPAKSIEEVLEDIARNATDDMATEIKELNKMLAQFGYAIPIGGGGGGKTNATGNNGTKATAIIADTLYSAISGGNPTIAGSQMPNSLRYLYESAGNQTVLGGNRIGSQTNTYGNVYTINGVTLTEAQAKTTTIYELAQRSRNLSLYSNAN